MKACVPYMKAFLGGKLSLPTGIERIARSTRVPLLHATTYTRGPSRLKVVLEPLPDNPERAIDETIRRLERDVRAHPWAWWHWGLLDRMWKPCDIGLVRQGVEQ